MTYKNRYFQTLVLDFRNFFSFVFLALWLTLPGCHSSAPQEPHERIVALTPSLASALLAVDPQADLAGTSLYTAWPEAAKRVATLPMPTPVEQVVSLSPSLVLVHPADVQLIAKLDELHIRVFARAMDTLPDIYETLESLGTMLQAPQKGHAAALALQHELDDIIKKYTPAPALDILFIIDVADARMQLFYIAQNDAFLAALSKRCGANTLATDTTNWGRITAESLLRLNPPAILFLSRDDTTMKEWQHTFSTLYHDLDAVKSGRVHFMNGEAYSIPDMRLPKTQDAICQAIDALRKTP